MPASARSHVRSPGPTRRYVARLPRPAPRGSRTPSHPVCSDPDPLSLDPPMGEGPGWVWERENAPLNWDDGTCLEFRCPVQEGHLVDATLPHPDRGVCDLRRTESR